MITKQSYFSSTQCLLSISIFTGTLSVWIAYKFLWSSKVKPLFPLSGKVVCLTGATGGLGKALGKSLVRRGARLILTGRRLEQLEVVRNELCSETDQDIAVVRLDMEELHVIPQIANQITEIHGNIDVLILNAGISSRGSVKESSFDVDQKMIVTNYLGPIAFTKALLPNLLKREFCIVAISSVQGKIAIPFRSSYAASKHALQAFFDSFRAELVDGHTNILVVSPSYIRTSLSLNALAPDGKPYGKMDEATAKGMDPELVAERIVRGIEMKESELIISDLSSKLGIILRALFPGLFMKLMRKRAQRTVVAAL